MMPRYHNSEVTNSKILANMAKTATPFPIFGQNSILRTIRTCFLDRRSFWNFTSEATINKMFMCRWKSLKLMRSGNFKIF